MDKNKKKTLIITLIAVGLLIAAVVGATYAYFSVTITGNQNASSIIAKSGQLGLVYTDGNEINATNVIPGWSESKTFTVQNTGTAPINYNIIWKELLNELVNEDLVYSVVGTTTNLSERAVPNTAGAILSNITIDAGETHEYTMTLTFINRATEQNINQGKTFAGKIEITTEHMEDASYQEEGLNGATPTLAAGLIPVTFETDGTVKVADTQTEWYNYTNKEWANVVTVDPSFTTLDAGATIPMTSIKQMYVWIPRYEYKFQDNATAAVAIDINYIDKNVTTPTSGYIIHPAFTVESENLNGMWIGKFEQGFDNTIKPDQNSRNNITISTSFTEIAAQKNQNGLDSTSDIHMIKNTEWGAVTYLSQSVYGVCTNPTTCSKVENNNYWNTTTYDITTGCGGVDTPVKDVVCPETNRWTTQAGQNASTTRNLTGIYDMAGGRWEQVMGNMRDAENNFYSYEAGFTSTPPSKYYDSYAYSKIYLDHTKGLTGDATKELNPQSDIDTNPNYNDDFAIFASWPDSWFTRGGHAGYGSRTGVFTFASYDGGMHLTNSSRSALWVME